MRYSTTQYIFMPLVVLLGLPTQSYATSGCPSVCVCKGDVNITVSCRFTSGNYSTLRFPNGTRTLNLSNNGLTHVPSELFVGLTQLISLSLSRNNISVIHTKAFKDLTSLQYLDFSYNHISTWDGQVLQRDFSSLITVDITNNSRWLIEKLINITSLDVIKGVTWNQVCINCILKRHTHGKPNKIPSDCNQAARYYFMGFYPTCKNKDQCRMYCKPDSKKKKEPETNANKNSDKRRKFIFAGYGIGSLAIVTNVIILINVLLSSNLRRDLSMLLILNMAVCDIMIGIYAIIMANSNIHDIGANADWSKGNITIQAKSLYCRVASVLMTTGEMVSVVASLLLTLEKYTCIVYCMSPDVRLRKNHVTVVMVTVWIASLVFALSPLYEVIQLKYSLSLMCTMPTNLDDKTPTFIIYPCAIISLNYLVMVPMYIHIFSVVNQSVSDMRVRRNATLAKKVFVMIGSNFVFFAIPMMLLVLYVFLYKGHSVTWLNQPISHFVAYEWLPVMLLAFNSFLNPFLFAFQYRKFQREFRVRFSGLLGCRLGLKLRSLRALTTITRMSYSTSLTRMDGDGQTDQSAGKRQSVRQLQIPANNDVGIALRRVTVGHSNEADIT